MHQLQGNTGQAVTKYGGQGQNKQMTQEFANHHLPARNRITQQQCHRPPVHLANNGVIRKQHGNQGDQENRQAGQADNRDG